MGIIRVQLAQDKDQLMQNAHREGPGTAGRVQDVDVIDGVNEQGFFGRVKLGRFFVVGEEMAQAFLQT